MSSNTHTSPSPSPPSPPEPPPPPLPPLNARRVCTTFVRPPKRSSRQSSSSSSFLWRCQKYAVCGCARTVIPPLMVHGSAKCCSAHIRHRLQFVQDIPFCVCVYRLFVEARRVSLSLSTMMIVVVGLTCTRNVSSLFLPLATFYCTFVDRFLVA